MKKGTIALDIDGTLTGKDHLIPIDVAKYLHQLHHEGWQCIFITGRPFSYALSALSVLEFPFLLGVQNGADLVQMPSRSRVSSHYLSGKIIPVLDAIYKEQPDDFILYAGYQKGDLCYYRPDRFTPLMLNYLKGIEKLSIAPWKAVKSFTPCIEMEFPLIKCMGVESTMELIEENIQSYPGIKTCVIKDPISESLSLTLINHRRANKGEALATFMEAFNLNHPIITAGDDNNDIPLLEQGDKRIAMIGAPDTLKQLAHIIAPTATQSGIIVGLQEAIGE